MSDYILNEEEQKVLIGLLYNQITFGTTLEVFGELSLEGIKRLDSLRSIMKNLLKNFGLIEKLNEDAYLVLGMPELIEKTTLEKWASDENNKHLQNRAKFFLKKFYGK